ncbi:hypothetical protein D910_07519 [Dendroctonus ponderosae]|uniref:Endonuclease/exonuclease/phosphatase domain-containing protein n=1 Tax=Dendroctonus ponderosae TaxID=77166 RepID=U4UJI8_DENPD|nr:hypothetical protein D910_07519 [Dendroctonus ponderosae]
MYMMRLSAMFMDDTVQYQSDSIVDIQEKRLLTVFKLHVHLIYGECHGNALQAARLYAERFPIVEFLAIQLLPILHPFHFKRVQELLPTDHKLQDNIEGRRGPGQKQHSWLRDIRDSTPTYDVREIQRIVNVRTRTGHMKKTKKKDNSSITLDRYAYDTAIMAKSLEDLQSLLEKVNDISEEFGLKLNISKTKRMARWTVEEVQVEEHRDKGFVVVELDRLVVVSSYFSPNGMYDDFESLIQSLTGFVAFCTKRVIIGGDLNAKTVLIGSRKTNWRGRMLEELVQAMGLTVWNTGNSDTFYSTRGYFRFGYRGACPLHKWVAGGCRDMRDHRSIFFTVMSHRSVEPVEIRRARNRAQYKEARKELKNRIKVCREKCWVQLVDELDDNIWGKAYQIVAKRLKTTSRVLPDRACVSAQVTKLFPVKDAIEWNIPMEEESNITLFPAEELRTAKSTESGRTRWNCTGDHKDRQRRRLVLNEKPKKTPESEAAYRPLCIIDSVRKLLEMLLKNRLQEEMEEKRLEHPQ